MGFNRLVNISLIILAGMGLSCADFRQCKDYEGLYTTRQTVITSPNYPKNYPPNVCGDYILRSPYRCPIDYHIQFLNFSLEASLNCANDFLAIGDVKVSDVDFRNYTGDILCGHVTGIRIYHARDGILRVRFMTNDAVESSGFRLLITRLSCEETSAGNISVNDSTNENKDNKLPHLGLLPPFQETSKLHKSDWKKQTNNNQVDVFRGDQYLPPSPVFYPQSSTPPTQTNNGYLPPPPPVSGNPCPPPTTSTWFQGQPYYPTNNNYPQNNNYPVNSYYPQQLPAGSCCSTNFQQNRFFLTSPSFPTRIDASLPQDCLYYIERSGPNVCRLKIVFRFFMLGSADPYSGQCMSDFIEIDGERICGCRTGFTYSVEWGLGAKVIRLKTYGRLSGIASIGFLLDVTQEDCGVRYSRQVVDSEKLTPNAIVETNTTTRATFYSPDTRETQHLGYSTKDGANSKLFFGQTNPCEFSYADLLRISSDTLWLTRPRC